MKPTCFKIMIYTSVVASVFLVACTDEKTAPEVLSLLPSTDSTINVGKEILFHPKVESDAVTDYLWKVDGEIKGDRPVFLFTPEKSGLYTIKLLVNNRYGIDSATAEIKVLPREIVIDFEELVLGSTGFWNGSAGTGKFVSGIASFTNNFNALKQQWYGFAYSNLNDTTSSSSANVYSVFDSHNLTNKFLVFNYSASSPSFITFDSEKAIDLLSIKICNTTYIGLSMLNGSQNLKKFGGDSGTDADYMKLVVTALDSNGNSIGSRDVYLADFLGNQSTSDYIIRQWTEVDLSSLGQVSRLFFSMESTWGPTAPLFFALDEIKYYEPE